MFKDLRLNWSSDLIAGFTIFLIALPLSVGIALASGCPPTAGILAAIIGGIFGAFLGGSYLTINGPAAGLIVIVIGAVQDLGAGNPAIGFKRMLAAAVVAGVLQVGMGLLRLGKFGTAVPGSVIHGMLTAIGVIIMAKQIHVALGVAPHSKEILELIKEIPHSVMGMNPEVALIAAVGFIIIIGLGTFKGAWTRFVPAAFVVAVVGLFMGQLFDFDHTHLVTSHALQFEVGPKLLLNLPDSLASAIIFPDFSEVFSATSWRYIIMLALVASIESLLTANAVDRLDPERRTSNLDRELWSKGICNSVCGLIGGMPIIAEIVRSSANIRNGARSPWSCFFHGVFILTFLVLFPHLLHEIPLAALAAVLISVGFRLAHPTQFFHTAEIGFDHFSAFMVTFVVTIASDLLIGVAAGIALEMILNFARGTTPASLFKARITESKQGARRVLKLNSPLTFTNFLSFQKQLEATKDAQVLLDLSACPIVDHTVLDQLHRYETEWKANGRKLELTFSDRHVAASKHPLAARRHVKRRAG